MRRYPACFMVGVNVVKFAGLRRMHEVRKLTIHEVDPNRWTRINASNLASRGARGKLHQEVNQSPSQARRYRCTIAPLIARVESSNSGHARYRVNRTAETTVRHGGGLGGGYGCQRGPSGNSEAPRVSSTRSRANISAHTYTRARKVSMCLTLTNVVV